jgi:isoleucyl-tRNA synthetase
MERAVLDRWKREHCFEASVQRREGGPEFVFYDGPPFATGLPHYGHILTSYIKDVVPRYWTMRGYHVPRRWGWDCHGLPVEFEIEKSLGLKSRADIVAYGIDKFNDACRSSVLKYAREWEEIIGRLGRWVDFGNDYKTMDPSYMESVIWACKALHDKGLLYEGTKVVPFCTRCQTNLSNFEARMDDATRPRQDPAVTLRFRGAERSEAFLVWTTTPWTLPSNVALAVGPDLVYAAYENQSERVWLAEAAAARYEKELAGYQLVERKLGRELAGQRYQPLFSYFADTANAFRVVTADFVSAEDGTGIVHLAPAFGEDDERICRAEEINGPNPVGDDGTFDGQVTDFAGAHVFDANARVLAWLKERGFTFRRETFEHNYPHCWRCDSPLIYRAIKTWFVKVTAFKSRLLDLNQHIRWMPEHIRDGRFGHWLENARDWAISRNRFWGAPIPVWKCDRCDAMEVIGGRQELEAKSGTPVTDWHRPAIDAVSYPCIKACGGQMRRVPEVLDCWFESGAMPYAQVHYPFERRAEFEATFPGDFIVEYVAQTRGWFYTLVVLAAALFDREPFKNVVCHGVILASDGRKMSKRLKNYPDPLELVEQHGSDAVRIALLSSAVVRGADLRFSADSVRDAVRRFCLPLWNSLHYFTAYARIDGFQPKGEFPALQRLDRYLLSECESLRERLEQSMDVNDFATCYEAIEEFIVLLSTWYIRLSKQRLWRPGMDDDKATAYETLFACLSAFAKMTAPFMPFLAESLYSALGHGGSVHLEDWPAPQPAWRDDGIVAEVRTIRAAVRLARAIREEHKLKHRHPLPSVAIAGLPEGAIDSNADLLLDELNVKTVRALDNVGDLVRQVVQLDFSRLGKRLKGDMKKVQAAVEAGHYRLEGATLVAAGHLLDPSEYSFRLVPVEKGKGVAAQGQLVVVLDLTSDPELVAEGQVRDLNRGLQDLRKKAALAYSDRITISIVGSPAVSAVVDAHREWLQEQLLAVSLSPSPLQTSLATDQIDVGGETVQIALAKVS